MTTLEIPVPPFVKKYLIKRYGTVHTLGKKSALGLLIIEVCTKRYIKPRPRHENDTELYTVQIKEYYRNLKAYNLKPAKLSFISDMLCKLFYENMMEQLIMDQEIGDKNAYKALTRFLEYYDIKESELKFESAYMYYRRKKKQYLKK